jgi:hypothetical protein
VIDGSAPCRFDHDSMSRAKQDQSGTRPRRKPRTAPPRRAQEWFLFCDEAGNAGSNWLDTGQPYHVAAGWLVRGSRRSAFEGVIQHAVDGSQAPELKGATLLRRASGVRTILDVFGRLGKLAMPFYVIADRSFCLAGKAVEAFLDPVTNPAAGWLPTGAFSRRQAVWETISGLPEACLVTFAKAYREPTPEGFREAATGIASALRLVADVDPDLVTSFEAAALNAAKICAYETHDSAEAAHGLVTALNAPLFLHLVKKADRVMEMHDGAKMVVVHDEIARFDRVFARALRNVTVPANASAEFRGLDGEFVRIGIRNVARFEVSPSSTSFGVQAADLLATSVARLCRDAREGRAWSDELRELAESTLPALIAETDDNDTPFAGMMGHQDSLARILMPLFDKTRTSQT